MAVQKLRRLLAGVQSRLSASYNHPRSPTHTHTHTHTHTPTPSRAGAVSPSTHPLFGHQSAPGRTQARAGQSGRRTGGGRDLERLRGGQALAVSQPAARRPDPPPRRGAGARERRRAKWVPRPSGPARPGPAAPLWFPPLRPARGVLALLHDPGGHISLRRDSSLPALVPRRQAGACSRERTPTLPWRTLHCRKLSPCVLAPRPFCLQTPPGEEGLRQPGPRCPKGKPRSGFLRNPSLYSLLSAGLAFHPRDSSVWICYLMAAIITTIIFSIFTLVILTLSAIFGTHLLFQRKIGWLGDF
ncbi:uncharacterized protein LOC125162896 [Prionailurus viverrinus]|uniref:uncharacterized protein LOC125162896 n=1 Tax=Prionailurus viverrinus TaxID=61388 RepID=UPI001FF53BD0|nr:uncharacterized protein LOC125162896 [Prionailurus viverrinus]